MLGAAFVLLSVGCADPKEQYGKTWYIDGAGNWGFGVVESAVGLEKGGYPGKVENYHWSLTMNPALDQTLRFIAQGAGARLGDIITDYLRTHPGAEVNVIGLSAGTGVGMWAIENVKPPFKVNNYVMLGSSLSSRYDARKALNNMTGKIYVYYSSSDPVLSGPVRALGTIDGSFDDSAGLVGLRGPAAATGRIVNISWSARFEKYGWVGGHTDATSAEMMQYEIAPKLRPGGTMQPKTQQPNQTRRVAN
jgi:hypothetical protein